MSNIYAGQTTTTALVQTGDTTGNLVLQTCSTPTTAMTISSSQLVNCANAPTVAGAALPSGAMSLISTQTASNSASLSWTGLTGYNSYVLMLKNLKPSSGVDNLVLVVGTGSTPTYITSGYYYVGIGVNNTTTITDSSLSASYISIDPGHVITSTDGLNSSLTLSGFTSDNFALTGTATNYYNSLQANALVRGAGLPSNSTAKTAIKINFLATNIGSGTASLYGISS